MTTPLRVDFETWTNGDYTEEFTLRVNSVVIELTGHSFEINAKLSPSLSTTVFSLNTVSSEVEGLYPVEPGAGKIQIRIDRATLTTAFTAAAEAGIQGDRVSIVYDMVVTLPSDSNEVWFYGFININRGITNV
jgi:hypothetical protein